MPNWCENVLEITGPEKDIKRFEKRAAAGRGKNRTPLSMEKFLPTPKKLLDNGGWYDWHIKNWGSKWDFADVEMTDRDKGYIAFMYSTAWGPIIEGITAIAGKFPSLVFILNYNEPGMAFAGDAEWQGGRMLYDDCRDASFCQECGDVLPEDRDGQYCENCEEEIKAAKQANRK